MDEATPQQNSYTNEEVASALDALAEDRGLETRFAAMRFAVIETLEASGYLKTVTASEFQNMLGDNVII